MSTSRTSVRRNPRDRIWYVNYALEEEVSAPSRYETVYVFIPFPSGAPQSTVEMLTMCRRQVRARNYHPQDTTDVTDPRGGMVLALPVKLRLDPEQRAEAIQTRADDILCEMMEEEGWDSEDEAAEKAAERA